MKHSTITKRKENNGVQVSVLYQTQTNRSIERYKARIMAKRYTQIYGVDYQ
jgi:hypothetical protein